ncbi:MAG: glycine cleavage system aminomethyltransferase GcvT [Candidatus Dadabacteria bacterium]|nr:glycine cleavage system aminomethyltransferase GcvT [Candidatus Dadabacteria bacterium]MYC39630.1 glycine cleavage system aminomethyltransferase GcvT [Candidatus Dadabacteria bacterium]
MTYTPLYETHKSFGARMIDFAGWKLPLQFDGIRQEHMAVRTACGLFDVSHMGEIEVNGPQAEDLCQRLNTNDMAKLRDGRARYGLFCYPDGGAVDDLITYRFSAEHFLVCVNASNTEKVYRWMGDNCGDLDVEVTDASAAYAQIAVQGPDSVSVMEKALGEESVRDFPRFSFRILEGEATGVIAARTGYTGEDGFELFVPAGDAVWIWERLYESGSESGITFCGLGARDTLRIEAGYPLYGNELDEKKTPIEAGLGRYVKMDKGDFIGRAALLEQMEGGTARKTLGFKMLERGVPRHGYDVVKNGKRIGEVTSGTMSPVLDIGVGIASVTSGEVECGDEIGIEIRGHARKAVSSEFPLHKD